jgi:hypothetical protein
MSDHKTRRRFLTGAGSIAALALAGCTSNDEDGPDNESMDEQMDNESMSDGESGMNDGEDGMDDDDDGMMSGPVTVTVRIENVAPTDFYPADASTGGQIWITPGAYGIHTGENPIYTAGEEASVGLEALAEAGPPTGFPDQPGLVDELQSSMEVVQAGAYTPAETVADPNDPMGEVPGAPPIAPGGAFEFEIEAEPGQRLSFASMFVPSNDLFFSPGADGIELWPEEGDPVEGDVTDSVMLFDAGTEPNSEPPGFGPDQAPAQDALDQGADEGGVVRPIDGVDDGHDYPAVEDAIQVTLTPQ